MTTSYPVIDRIREVRLRISEEHDHDPQKLVDHYIEQEQRDRDRILDLVNIRGAQRAKALTT